MGNTLICEKCEPAKPCNESVINLSDNCMDRLTNDEKSKKGKETKDPKDEDDEWMMKLKCLDDIHTNNYGLTIQAIDEFFNSLEAYFGDIPKRPCQYQTMLFCVKNNENCMIHCKKLLDEYIDCVDMKRILKIQERMELEKTRLKQQEENELANKISKDEKE